MRMYYDKKTSTFRRIEYNNGRPKTVITGTFEKCNTGYYLTLENNTRFYYDKIDRTFGEIPFYSDGEPVVVVDDIESVVAGMDTIDSVAINLERYAEMVVNKMAEYNESKDDALSLCIGSMCGALSACGITCNSETNCSMLKMFSPNFTPIYTGVYFPDFDYRVKVTPREEKQ